MNEGDILDMGKRLMEEHQELELKRKELEKTMLSFKKHLSIRSILSSMLFPDDEEEGQIDFGLYL